jgi:DNA gyrase/topoisomerase IV subunit B
LLLTTLFLYHLPELIKQGKVYAAVSPLYKVIDARKNVIYLYDEKEANKWFRTHTGYEATHIKGLN